MSERQFRWFAATAIVAAGILAYANSLRNEFVWDDASSILIHQHVQDPSQFFQLFREDLHAYGRGQGNFYRPLLAASFMLDYALSRPAPDAAPSPLVFHVSSIAWHIAAALLFLALLLRMQAPRFACLAAPLLFAVHPLHTEAVTYISGRGDSMAGAFMLAGLWFALWENGPRQRLAGLLCGTLCFIAALLSKESALIYPVLLLFVLAAAPHRDDGSPAPLHRMRRAAPLVAAVAATAFYALLRMTILHFGEGGAANAAPLLARAVQALQSFSIYIRLLFIPTGLHMERTLEGVPGWHAAIGGVLLLACAGGIGWGWRTRRYRLVCAMGWFLAAWLPISGIFPLNAPLAEHWLYMPMIGFLWALAEIIWFAASRRTSTSGIAIGLVAAACVACIAFTAARNQDWRNNETLFLDTLSKSPDAVRVHFNLAVTYEDILHNRPGARREYERVLVFYEAKRKAGQAPEEMGGDELESLLSLGRISAQEQQFDMAARQFEGALKQAPTPNNSAMLAEAALGLAHCYRAMGDTNRIQPLLDRAVQLNPALKPQVDRMRGRGGAVG